jgi:hypothetical protein
LGDAALYGFAGEIVHTIEPHSESDPVALLLQFLTAFGSVVGFRRHFMVEAISIIGHITPRRAFATSSAIRWVIRSQTKSTVR